MNAKTYIATIAYAHYKAREEQKEGKDLNRNTIRKREGWSWKVEKMIIMLKVKKCMKHIETCREEHALITYIQLGPIMLRQPA